MASKNNFQFNMNELKKHSKFKIKKHIFNIGFDYKKEIENIYNTESKNEIKQKLKHLLNKCINDQKIVAEYKKSNSDKIKDLSSISHLKTHIGKILKKMNQPNQTNQPNQQNQQNNNLTNSDINKNIPLIWCHNSCWMDTFFVAVLYNKNTHLYKFFYPIIKDIFKKLVVLRNNNEQLDLDELIKNNKKICLMDYIDELNIILEIPPSQYFKKGISGVVGEIIKKIYNQSLNLLLGSDSYVDDVCKIICNKIPIIIRDIQTIKPNDNIETLKLTLGGNNYIYQLLAISGLKNGHWETLVKFNDIYKKINIYNGTNIEESTIDKFMKKYRQHKFYYEFVEQEGDNNIEDECKEYIKKRISKFLHSYNRYPNEQIKKQINDILLATGEESVNNLLTNIPIENIYLLYKKLISNKEIKLFFNTRK
jgi:hypothetical protein